MRRMHTKEEIFEFVKQSPTAAELAELIANTVAFDRNEARENGLVYTQMIGGDWGIKKEDIPAEDGVYRTAYGIFVKMHTGQYSYKVLALYSNNFYIQNRDNTTETDFLFVAANLLVKPVYCHPITLIKGSPTNREYLVTLMIFNNSSSKLDTWNKLKDAFLAIRALTDDTARFPATGSLIVSGKIKATSLISVNDATSISLVFVDEDNVTVNYDMVLNEPTTVLDGVNRIN